MGRREDVVWFETTAQDAGVLIRTIPAAYTNSVLASGVP